MPVPFDPTAAPPQQQTIVEVIKHSDHLFERQASMVSLWQVLADNFYPERADFTVVRNIGQEMADDLIDSYPILARRDMANSLDAMLRDGEWYKMGITGEADTDGKQWLEWATKRLRVLMDDRVSGFKRATKEGDHDYVTFGQCVLSVELNKLRNGLLYRCWHLRDVAWYEDETGQVCSVHRKWRPTYYQLVQQFGRAKVHANVVQKMTDHPHADANCRHIVMPSAMYGESKWLRFKYVSLIIDVENQHIIEAVGRNNLGYIVPRFQTVAGSQYAYSPATVCALPDARLIQAMTHTLLEAGERYVRPPLVATATVVRGDVDLSPDGITWVDKDYDERLGGSLRPLDTQRGGYPIGLELREEVKNTIASCFYLNKITLPATSHEMTAYEVQERMKQFRRENLPLFSPIEADYNGQLCEESFDLAFGAGLLGSPYDVPESLQGNKIAFKFKSPLTSAEEEMKAQHFRDTAQILATAIEFDPAVDENIDLDMAMREAIEGIGAPARWLVPLERVAQAKAAASAMAAQANQAALPAPVA